MLKYITANSLTDTVPDHRVMQLNETVYNFHLVTSLDKYFPL